MSGVSTPERIRELEAALCRIPAVDAVRAVLTRTGEIAEMHIVATQERSPKLIVRDVQSVARAMFDLEIDYRKVSVVHLPAAREAAEAQAVAPVQEVVAPVQEPLAAIEVEIAEPEPDLVVLERADEIVTPPAAEPEPAPAPAQDVRETTARAVRAMHVEPSVARVVISQSGALTEVAVDVAGAGTAGSASVRGPSSQVAMLAARAALAARETLGADDAATVAGVEESVVAGRRVVIVAVIVAGAAGEAFATACAPVTGSVAEAAAAAALQAVAGRAG